MNVDSIGAGAIEISGQRSESTLKIRRTAGRVVPGIADIVSGRGIEGQRVSITVEGAIQRHSGIDSVVQSTLYNIGKLCFSGNGQHAPVPHHVADRGTTFAVGAEIGQLVGISERFSIGSRTDPAGDVHFRGSHVVPESGQ